ncbi:MAG TPA: TIR domain-containing protein [Nevskiaceae bacterium]|nr:TIR domain-containing protein [Nevskiaceae bacterium]
MSKNPPAGPGTESGRYWAFISYSHADEAVCRWLHRRLEHYRIPTRLVGRASAQGFVIPRRLFPVFRDRDELAGAAELGRNLETALEQSLTQIVICSPQAARSDWVNEEIRFFKRQGRAHRVLALIVDGEPNATRQGQPERECFPEALRFQVDAQGRITDQPAEPIAADLRPGRDGPLNAQLKLISGILDVGFDELRQRDLQARNRRLAILSGLTTVVAGITLVLAVLALQARDEARAQQHRAEAAQADAQRRQRQAEALIGFMLGDLRGKLEPIGKLDILDAVGNQAMEYFATLDDTDRTEATLGARAKALRQIGEVRLKQGDVSGASLAFEQALTQLQALAEQNPDDIELLLEIAESIFAVGHGLYAKGQHPEALLWMDRYADTAQRILRRAPTHPRAQLAQIQAAINRGAILLRLDRTEAARTAFQSAEASQRLLLEANPGDREALDTLSSIHAWLAFLHGQAGEWTAAREQAARMIALARQRLALAPDDAAHRQALASALQLWLYNQDRIRPYAPTAPELAEALALTADLVALDPANVEYLRAHWVSLSRQELALSAAGALDAAQAVSLEALALTRRALQRAPGKAQLRLDHAVSTVTSARLAWLRGDTDQARALVAAAWAEPALIEMGDDPRLLDLRLTTWLIDPARLDSAAAGALGQWLVDPQSVAESRAESRLLAALLLDQAALARRLWESLTPREREHPFLRRLCGSRGDCRPPGAGA